VRLKNDSAVPKPRDRRLRSAVAVAALGVVLPLAAVSSAQAYEISSFKADVYDQNLNPVSQAGAHPYQGIIEFTTAPTSTDSATAEPDAYTETIRTDTPAGLVPNPEAPAAKCTQAQLQTVRCPATAQIGQVALRLRTFLPAPAPAGTRGTVRLTLPLYNMERANDGQLARFSFNPAQAGQAGDIVDIVGGVRDDGDYGLYFTINDVARPNSARPTAPSLTGSKLTFWGSPSSPDHQVDRGRIGLDLLAVGAQQLPAPQPQIPTQQQGGNVAVANTGKTFLTNPTSCTGPVTSRLTLDTYAADESQPTAPAAGSGLERTQDYTIGQATNGATGCDRLGLTSSTTFGVSDLQRDAPTALAVLLNIDQSTSYLDGGNAASHVKQVAVTLPPGMTISPSAANGLEACTDAQFGKGTKNAISCPAASRLGAVAIKSPVLDRTLTGSVYVGQPLPGNRYRLFVNADGPAISLRLVGTVTPDPQTGQVRATFDDNPQLPFSQFRLDFDGGSKAIIASPQACGATTGTGTLVPWSGGGASVTNSTVDVQNCAGNPFAPTFGATTADGRSGRFAPLVVGIGRPDGDQFLNGLQATLPAGMTAKIKGVEQCSEAQIAAESCSEASRIGTVRVQAGPGAAPYALSGPVYLTGGYKGGAFGAVVIIRAVAGPYDLGNVVVRQALRIDPNTAQVTVDSDPLPQIKEGILLRLRDLQIDVNRGGFLRNPTSCGIKNISSTLTGGASGSVTREAGVQFSGCTDLNFRPKIAIAFGNRSQMRKGGHPRVTATVTQKDGEAGIKSTQVALPKQVALQASNAKGLCEKADAQRGSCPASSIVGKATAESPVLNRPVTGPVYFVKGTRITAAGKEVPTLPTFFIPLSGEVRINLRAVSSVSQDRLVTTFPSIPDQPISKFTLDIKGGKAGIIAATRNLCTAKAKASSRFVGQNGEKAPTRSTKISTACKVAKK
jgi:hypothetical protein